MALQLFTCGYDDDIFVNQPGEDLGVHCPVCLLVLREPHLLSCCGRHLCEFCMRRIKNAAGSACPCCRNENFNSLLNKEKRGVVLGLKVYCTNKDIGCTWTGELGDVGRHLETRCDHVLQDCPNGCGQSVPRHSIQDHTTRKCTKRPIEVQLECLTQDMMETFSALETKYKEKVSILEEMIRQQDVKIANLVDDKKLNKQKAELEERLRRQFQQQNDKLSRELREDSEVTSSILKKRLDAVETTSVTCSQNIEKINDYVQEMKSNVFFQSEIPIYKDMLKYIQALPLWRKAMKDGKNAEVQCEIKESSITLQCRRSPAKQRVEEAAERVSLVIASLQKKFVTFPPEREEVLQYILDRGNGYNKRLQNSTSTIVDLGGLVLDTPLHQAVNVTVYGKTQKSVYEVCSELEGFVENKETEKTIQLLNLDYSEVEAFAMFKSVRLSRQYHVEIFRPTVTLIGKKFNVLLVEDCFREMNLTV